MVITFKCSQCKKRYYFSNYKNNKVCLKCFKENEELKRKKLREEKIKKRKEENKKRADEELLKELKKKKIVKQKKEKKIKEKVEIKSEEKKIEKKFSIEEETEKLKDSYDTLLYVYADVKRIKAIEWRRGKKKVLLNKEREIRRTHKGGWSQEKFQRFVDFQKKQAPNWIEENLLKKGVLRPPYEKIVIDSEFEPKICIILKEI